MMMMMCKSVQIHRIWISYSIVCMELYIDWKYQLLASKNSIHISIHHSTHTHISHNCDCNPNPCPNSRKKVDYFALFFSLINLWLFVCLNYAGWMTNASGNVSAIDFVRKSNSRHTWHTLVSSSLFYLVSHTYPNSPHSHSHVIVFMFTNKIDAMPKLLMHQISYNYSPMWYNTCN